MTYQSFEELPVWQSAAELYEACAALLVIPALRASSAFRDQLERAALSVSNNIAEGFERGTTNELLTFIYIARGSAGEVRSMLRLLLRRLDRHQAGNKNLESEISNLKSEVTRLIALAESCSRQLRAWADSLQNSEIKGQRFLTEKVRQQDEQRKRSEAFRKELLRKLPPDHPMRKDAEERGLI